MTRTDWAGYGRCGSCDAPPGHPCRSRRARNRKPLNYPHAGRTRIRQGATR